MGAEVRNMFTIPHDGSVVDCMYDVCTQYRIPERVNSRIGQSRVCVSTCIDQRFETLVQFVPSPQDTTLCPVAVRRRNASALTPSIRLRLGRSFLGVKGLGPSSAQP